MSENEKVRLAIRIQPETKQKIDQWYAADNCRSMNEFIEKAVNFYVDHLAMEGSRTLPTAVTSAIDGRLGMLEDRLSALAFNNAVELDILARIIANEYQDDAEGMRELRARSVQNVKRTNGRVSLRDLMKQADDAWLD